MKNKVLRYGLITILIISSLIILAPLVSYAASSHYIASEFIIEQQINGSDFEQTKIISANIISYWWFLKYHDDLEYNLNLEKSDIARLNEINNISELEDYFEAGYKYIILDEHMCYDIPLIDYLKVVKPIKTIPNDVARSDPLLFNDFQQQPYLAKSDMLRYRRGTCDRDSFEYRNVLIYLTEDVVKHHYGEWS